MRKRLRFAVAAVVVLLLVGVGFLVARSLWEQHQDDLERTALEFLPGVSQHIRDFHRVKVQDGRKVWEVAAQDAQYIDGQNTVVVRNAMMQLFLKDGRTLGLRGDEGRILLEGREVARVELGGNIQVTWADYTVRTARATYDHTLGTISAPEAVEIFSRALHLRADHMELAIEAQHVTLQRNVAMQVEPALLKQGAGDAPL
jgi:LPS export ABC transporter protein LptC